MEWLGLISFVILLCYSSYPGKIKSLEKKVKKLQKKNKEGKEGNEMSRLIQDLVGKKCRMETEDDALLSGNGQIVCDVLDADEDCVKLAYEDKDKGRVTKLIRVETIIAVDVVEGI